MSNFLKIIKGVINHLFGRNKKLSEKRLQICKGCDYYDKNGESELAVFPNTPACSLCGCVLAWKTKIPSEKCTMAEFNQEPKW